MGRNIALGAFDGLHIAHCAVLRGADAVLLFAEHPQKVLRGSAPPQLLTDEERDERLQGMGIALLKVSFEEVARLGPEAFFCEVLLGRFGAAALRCGYHYRFGAGAAGDAAMLRALCRAHGLGLTVVPKVEYKGAAVSSTRIRAALRAGRMDDANAMLGRAFGYDFTVVEGERVGRTLGVPTLNQRFPEGFAAPRNGVYASQAYVGGRWRASVTNVGRRPCFASDELRSETHVIGFEGDLYGRKVPVRLLRYLRPERRFDSLDELKKQIERDILLVEGCALTKN